MAFSALHREERLAAPAGWVTKKPLRRLPASESHDQRPCTNIMSYTPCDEQGRVESYRRIPYV